MIAASRRFEIMTLIQRYFDNCSLHRLEPKSDDRGSLIAIEAGREVPFAIERVYYLYGTGEGVERGFHGHKALHQLMVCVAGSCAMSVDDGHARHDLVLDSPEIGLRVGPMIWREMRDFAPGSVMMVVASLPYDEGDYLRDYDAFRALACEPRKA